MGAAQVDAAADVSQVSSLGQLPKACFGAKCRLPICESSPGVRKPRHACPWNKSMMPRPARMPAKDMSKPNLVVRSLIWKNILVAVSTATLAHGHSQCRLRSATVGSSESMQRDTCIGPHDVPGPCIAFSTPQVHTLHIPLRVLFRHSHVVAS